MKTHRTYRLGKGNKKKTKQTNKKATTKTTYHEEETEKHPEF